jgi:hypothetical protein
MTPIDISLLLKLDPWNPLLAFQLPLAEAYAQFPNVEPMHKLKPELFQNLNLSEVLISAKPVKLMNTIALVSTCPVFLFSTLNERLEEAEPPPPFSA